MKNKERTFNAWVKRTPLLDFDADDRISDDVRKMIINACHGAYVTGRKDQRHITKAMNKVEKG